MAINSAIAAARASGGDVRAAIKASRQSSSTSGGTSTTSASKASTPSSPTPASTGTPLYKPGTVAQVYNAQTGAVIPGATSSFTGTTSTPTGSGITYSGTGATQTQTFGTPIATATPTSTQAKTIAGSLSQVQKAPSSINANKTPLQTQSSINSPTMGSVLSSQTTSTINSPAGKKTTKDLVAEANKAGLTGQAKRDFILSGRADKKIAQENTILKQQESLIEDSKKEAERVQKTEQERVEQDKVTLLDTKAKNQETIKKYFEDSVNEEQSYYNEYESEQNRLLSEGESTQLNQVRSQIYQALAARGIDISKLPPEQLIALSGEVGTRAFANIFQMKEGVKNRILAASRDKLNKINDLRNRQTINDAEYNEAVQAINSQAKLQANQIDTQFAQTILGAQNQLISLREKATVSNATLAQSLGKELGLSAEQVGVINKLIDPNKTAAENQTEILKMTQDPNSELSKAQAENKAALAAAAMNEYTSKYNLAMLDNETKLEVARIQNQVSSGRLGLDEAKFEFEQALENAKLKAGYYNERSGNTGYSLPTGTASGTPASSAASWN